VTSATIDIGFDNFDSTLSTPQFFNLPSTLLFSHLHRPEVWYSRCICLMVERESRTKMLKVTFFESPTEQRFVVEGKLAQAGVPELESAWKSEQAALQGRRCVLDLSDATFIDESGSQLLKTMCREGVQIIAKGPYVKYLIRHLKRNGAKSAPCLSQDGTQETR
jgi:hypothetical protein